MYFNDEFANRLRRLAQSPFAQAQERLDSHPLPAMPSGVGASPSEEQRAWKTILEGGTVGNIVQLTSATLSAQVVTVAGPNEQAEVMGVTLIPPLVPFGPIVNFGFSSLGHDGAAALIQWGVGGGVSSVEIDVSRGCAFTLVASAIRIFMRREIEPGFPISAFAPNLFGACVSKGPVASPTRPTRSFNSKVALPAGIVPSGQFQITIPPYAKFLSVYSFVDVGGFVGNRPMYIDLQTFNGVSCGQWATGLNQISPRIELPNQASFVSIINLSATETVNMQAVFELAL